MYVEHRKLLPPTDAGRPLVKEVSASARLLACVAGWRSSKRQLFPCNEVPWPADAPAEDGA